MSKLSYEDKIEIYKEYKLGVGYRNLAIKYNVRQCVVQYLICLIDRHGVEILRTTKNKEHLRFEKEKAINRVLLDGESV